MGPVVKKKKKKIQNPSSLEEKTLFLSSDLFTMSTLLYSSSLSQVLTKKHFLLQGDKVPTGVYISQCLHYSLIFQGTSLLLKSLLPYKQATYLYETEFRHFVQFISNS